MNTAKNKVAVAILNWNGIKFLKQFLPSVIKNAEDYVNIYVIDNGSVDNSLQFLQQHYSEVKTIELNNNCGFAGGYNKGLQQINEEYCILLNSDVEVTPNWINPIIRLMDNDKTIGACQPKIKDYNNKNYFEYAGAAGGFIDKYGYPYCRGRIFDTVEKDEGQYNDTIETFWATGACMFVRREAFIAAGQLDNSFFAHMEEIDLCWRMKNIGYKIMYCGDSTVYHVGGGTLQKSNPKKTYLNFRNSLLTLYKNLPNSKVLSVIIYRLILDGLAALKFILGGAFKDAFAIIRAHFSFYSLVKQYQKSTAVDYPSQMRNSNIVFDYYLHKRKKYTDLK